MKTEHYTALLRLSLPYVILQGGMLALGLQDISTAKRFGEAATSITGLLIAWRLIGLIIPQGACIGLTPVFARAFAQGDRREARDIYEYAHRILIFLGAAVVAWYFMADHGWRLMGLPPTLTHQVDVLCRASVLSIAFFILYSLGQAVLIAANRPMPVVCIVIAANLLKAALNHYLTGKNGLEGIVQSTNLVSAFMCFAVAPFATRQLAPLEAPFQPSGRRLIELAGLSIPVGLSLANEIALGNAAFILAGRLGATALAAHTIVSNLYTIVATLPICIAAAASIRVAQMRVQGKDWSELVFSSIDLGLYAVALPLVLFFALPVWVGQWFTLSGDVLALLRVVLPILAVMHLFDSTQIIVLGLLRGIGDVVGAVILYSLGLWVVSFPLAWAFAFPAGMGLAGLWSGLLLGVFFLMLVLLHRVYRAARSINITKD